MQRRNKGFTLIELLVVIAIIGILASVVLASLNNARNKGRDAAIQSDLDGVRTTAELAYTDLNNSYNGTGAAVNSAACSTVTTANTIFDTSVENGSINRALVHAITQTLGGADVGCNVKADGSAYAMNAALNAGGYWCIDSSGAATTTSSDTLDVAGVSGGPYYDCAQTNT